MLLIKNGYLISPENKIDGVYDILIENGKIKEIKENITADCEIIDATGKYVLPGIVDMHVHLRDPGFTYKEDIFTGCEAAAAGGVTSVLAMPNTNPAVDNTETVKYIIDKAKSAKAKVYPVACITKGLNGEVLTDMKALKKAGAVAVSDDGRPVKNAKMMLDGLKSAFDNSLLAISHCEDLDLIDGGIIHKGEVSETLGVKGMTRASEDSITAREIALADSENLPIHIAHVSTKGSVEIIRDAKKRGIKVTCETCPHYFIFDHTKLLKKDADYRMNPPLREDFDIKAVTEGIIDRTIDCIVTDHAPHAKEEKSDFLKAPNGVVGLETSFSASYTHLVATKKITLSHLVELMSVNPAKLLNIEGGVLKEGAAADICIADLDREWTVDPEKLHSKSKNSVFKDVKLKSKIICTILNGTITYKED